MDRVFGHVKRSGRRMLIERRSSQRRNIERREQNMWVLTDRRSGLDRRGDDRRATLDRRVMGDRRRAERN